MRHRERFLPLLVFGAAVAALPPAALHFVNGHKIFLPGSLHFGAVGITALAATAAAIALTWIGARNRDGRTVVVGTAFSAMAALLALHGLATPGILVGFNGVVAFTGGSTLPVGGAILALVALPALRGERAVGALLVLQTFLLAAILALGISALFEPGLVPSVPEPNSPLALAALGAGLLFFSVLGLRSLHTFLLTRRPADLLVAVGIAWLGAATVPALTQSYWMLSWWLGHGFELAGILLVGIPVAIDATRLAPSHALVGDLRATDLVSAEESFLGSHVRALLVRLAARDTLTEEHVRRVALRAVQVAEELRLPPGKLRALAAGGLLHDIGKLAVPETILKKPESLDEEEFAIVRRHSALGNRLLRQLGGFDEDVRRLVLDHHERLDGSGYPRGVGAADLDLDARILGVCDVYDALVSHRAYRPAWTHVEAMNLLRSQPEALDQRCVLALERVLARECLAEPAAAA